MHTGAWPQVIQGGMGIGISDWRLARAVASRGQLGVVSGTGIDTVFVRRLQDGDPDGDLRRVMARFPMAEVAEDAERDWFIEGGRAPDAPYRLLPMYHVGVPLAREQLTMLAAFCEVALAKEGHDGVVGMNLLTKVQFPTLASLYGAMLAGVDVVIMGAGIPREVPGVLDAFAEHRPARMRLETIGGGAAEPVYLSLDPSACWTELPAPLARPAFFPIVSSNSLATMLARKANGRVDGFVVEGATAGGHNAPPRGTPVFNERGEPLYGPRDAVDLAALAELGLPFWVAGGAGGPAERRAALAAGAAGIQVGTLFAYAEESGLEASLKRSVLEAVQRGEVDVYTDAQASPTGYPFKVVRWPEAPSTERERICDLGYLRVVYHRDDGRLGYRCAAEPVRAFVQKGGEEAETCGRRCLCNVLMADIALGQVRPDGRVEPPLLTSGDGLLAAGTFLDGRTAYTAGDVLEYLLA
ncbi:MAG: nitronate monooxygenase [Gemmatimonadales bacterium]|nr:nitronate monooxygenase [Gemmatimonadales bacterium]